VKNGNDNITLIGMAGAGKSTIGPPLADKLGYAYVDSDDLISAKAGTSLQEIVNRLGPDGFRRLEEDILLNIALGCTVIATGGSAIYSQAAMAHLQQLGPVVFLDVGLSALQARRLDLGNRGLINPSGGDFAELYRERHPLYLRYADLCINCDELSPAEIVDELQNSLMEIGNRKSKGQKKRRV
jgi:shikimate kinase